MIFIDLMKRRTFLVLAALLLLAVIFVWSHYIQLWSASGQIIQNDSDRLILINVDEKRLYLLENGEVLKKFTVATGKSGFSSPIGDWKIVNKGTAWGKGFGSRWMGLNVPWGCYGIHGTNDEGRIGQAVSHGCIRMRNRDVIELYKLVQIGTPVIIRNGPYGQFGMGFKTVKPGQRGADVMAVQKRLRELGYYTGPVNGIYGESLKQALNAFQRRNGLPVENNITHDDYTAMGFIEFE